MDANREFIQPTLPFFTPQNKVPLSLVQVPVPRYVAKWIQSQCGTRPLALGKLTSFTLERKCNAFSYLMTAKEHQWPKITLHLINNHCSHVVAVSRILRRLFFIELTKHVEMLVKHAYFTQQKAVEHFFYEHDIEEEDMKLLTAIKHIQRFNRKKPFERFEFMID